MSPAPAPRFVGRWISGFAASAALSISNGAAVTATSVDVGIGKSAVGQVSVIGLGSNLTISGAAIVGDEGDGLLSVLSGATFTAASLTAGALGGSSAELVVSGTGNAEP